MTTKMRFLFALTLLCVSCQTGKPTKIDTISYNIYEPNKNGIISDITSLFFITPEIGFSCMPIRKELGTYPLGTLFRQTTDGGKSWTTLSFFKDYVKGIQYYDGILYVFYEERDKENRHISSPKSHIIFSEDGGNIWDTLCTFDNRISNFYVFDNQTMSVVKRESELDMIYQSKNGGGIWTKASVPEVDDYSYISRVGDKLYYTGKGDDWTYGKTSLFDYNIVTEVLNEQCFDNSIHAIYVSDGMLSFSKNGCNIRYYTLKNNNFEFTSKIDWGAFLGGSQSTMPLIKDGRYVFSFISQYPGRNNINQALYFSETGGEKWRKIREFKVGEGIGYDGYNVYKDDSIFQVSYCSMDSLRIFRVKKQEQQK